MRRCPQGRLPLRQADSTAPRPLVHNMLDHGPCSQGARLAPLRHLQQVLAAMQLHRLLPGHQNLPVLCHPQAFGAQFGSCRSQ